MQKGEGAILGKSVSGKYIEIFKFGRSDQPAVLVLGGQHGDESRSVDFSIDMVQYFRKYPEKVPAYLQLWIIPVMNIDGYLNNNRLNANQVDLNRNFGSRNWRKTTVTNKYTFVGGGGARPFSEPETRAVADLITLNQHRLLFVFNIHCCGALVIGAKSSKLTHKLEKVFMRYSRYRTIKKKWSKTYYPVTGSMSAWLREKPKVPDLFLELRKRNRNSFKYLRKATLKTLQSSYLRRMAQRKNKQLNNNLGK